MRLALKLSTDATLTELDLDAPEGSLQVLQSAVGGLIEPIDFDETLTMYVNEEGKLGGFELNRLATMIFLDTFEMVDVVMGDVVFTGGVDARGRTMGLSDEAESDLRGVVRKFVVLGQAMGVLPDPPAEDEP